MSLSMPFLFAARLVPAVVLVVAGFGKLFNLPWFVKSVRGYGIVPAAMAVPAAAFVVGLEIVMGCGLLFYAFMPQVAYVGALLLFVFSLLALVSILRGRSDLDCGCTGPALKVQISWRIITRNIGLACLTLLGIRESATIPSHSLLVSGLLVMVAATVVLDFRKRAPCQEPRVSAAPAS